MGSNSTFMPPLWHKTRITSPVDFTSGGKHCGDLQLKYSDNETALGYIPVPAGVIVGSPGPTVLLIAGVHGDEFEGPVTLIKLFHALSENDVTGRIIMFPALNAPAVRASSRVSPIDQGNLNRAFPGNRDATPTQMIAHFVEHAVIPVCDAVIDIHSGGKAAWFAPCAMAAPQGDRHVAETNLRLAEAFLTPLIWRMGKVNDTRSVNYAAHRKGKPSIAAELGGGGQVTPETLAFGERGIRNCLRYLNILDGEVEQTRQTAFQVPHVRNFTYAPHAGLFEPAFEPGDHVKRGDTAGFIHPLGSLDTPPSTVKFTAHGIAFARSHRGLAAKGEFLAAVGEPFDAVDTAD